MKSDPSAAGAARSRRRWLRIIWPFLVTVALLLLLSNASLHVMSGMRAFVSAESLWSKAQKTAVGHIEQYAATRNEDAYQRYLTEMAVIAGMRTARVELDKPEPDLDAVRAGFRNARNHPADMESMIDLFRRFRNVGFMATAITIWTQADAQIAELDATAQALHAAVGGGKVNLAEVQALASRVRAIDRQLTPWEEAFSATLEEASRQTTMLLAYGNIAVAVALVLIAVLRTRGLVRQGEDLEGQLRTSEERLEYALVASTDGFWDWSLGRPELYFSPRFEQLLGYEDGTMRETAASFLWRIHSHDRRSTMERLRAHLRRGEAFDLEFRIRVQGGAFRWFRSRGRAMLGTEGKPARMAGSLTDITDRKQAEAQIFEEKERAQVTLASIADAVITIDTSGRIEFINPVAERLTGWDNGRARGSMLSEVFAVLDENTGIEIPDPVGRALRERCVVKSEGNVVLRRRDDAPVAIDYSVAPIRDRASSVVGAVLVFHDMSRERQYAARLSHLASHDPLTGLPNRREFERRLNLTLSNDHRDDFNHAVLYLDLDQFKVVNDTCGHAAGDELLRQVTGLLRPLLREGDTLARLGGDEFGVLLEHCPPEPAARIAETMRGALADFRFVWKTRSFNGSVSVGLVNVSDGGQTLAGVLSAADAACYMAKDKGRNRVQVYSSNSSEMAVRHGEMEWVNRIQHALAENRFCLFAQPVCATRGDRNARPYTELLLRLRDETNELIPPVEFIPAAERYNLMPAIDRWVITTAFAIIAQNSEVHGTEEAPETFAINLSGASISEDDFLDFVCDQFERFGIRHQSICFEITETNAVTSLSKATDFMRALQAHGCRFALDDFGVGLSSFSYLKHLPADFVKIDGSFVVDMLQNPVNRAMVQAIHDIGHILGKKTIAESVETVAILDALDAIGVDYAQGFAVAPPRIFGQLRRAPANKQRAIAAA
ncbi:MAG TPA: EAL domain-containing protein [Casimicrobiaceae bacterium]|nr:EAL domain-containing protein [Casimicrobiaceae bacterium]